MTATIAAQSRRTTFADVLGVRDFRSLWLSQLLSIAGDQFARVALTVLMYARTGSGLLAAITFGVSVLPLAFGSLALGWLADAFPRRTVMLVCDLACAGLVALMVIPGVPLAAQVALLFCVTLASAPFMSARMAISRNALGGGRLELGMS